MPHTDGGGVNTRISLLLLLWCCGVFRVWCGWCLFSSCLRLPAVRVEEGCGVCLAVVFEEVFPLCCGGVVFCSFAGFFYECGCFFVGWCIGNGGGIAFYLVGYLLADVVEVAVGSRYDAYAGGNVLSVGVDPASEARQACCYCRHAEGGAFEWGIAPRLVV